MSRRSLQMTMVLLLTILFSATSVYCQTDDSSREILKQGLLGAGTGAIASGASGGNAGKGALIGAGTGVIGGILLDAITSPPRSSRRTSAPPPQDDYYYEDQPQEYYEEPPQESSSQKVLKQGLLGAGTGAIAAGASGGKAGEGALIGAGTGIVGGALLDMLTQPPQQQSPRRVYRRPQQQSQPYQQQYQAKPQTAASQNIQVQDEVAGSEGGKKRVIKKYDPAGKLISEEEVYY